MENQTVSAVMTDSTPAPAAPRQLVLECKLQDCDVVLELKTHGETKNGVHSWTGLSAQALLQRKKLRRHTAAYQLPPVTVSWSMAELSSCHISRWSHEDSLWIGGTAFKTRKEEFSRLSAFLLPLGIEINDRTKDSGS